jgi:hypothetical protein
MYKSNSDKTAQGIKELERKQKEKEPGSVTFHIDDYGKCTKVFVDKVIK